MQAQVSFTESDQDFGKKCTWDVKLVDIDHDSDLDILFANFSGSQKSELWINDGSGNFTLSDQQLPSSQHICAMDLNGDSFPEVICKNRLYSNSNGVLTYVNIGLESKSGEVSECFEFIDFDNDGNMDIAQANLNEIVIYKNQGNLNFSISHRLTQTRAREITCADFNNDGFTDMYIGSISSNSNSNGESDRVWINDGNGNFTVSSQQFGNYYAICVNTADVNNDGFIDIVAGNMHPSPTGASQPNKLWMNNGDNSFSESNSDILNYDWSSPYFIDANGDSLIDLVLFNAYGSSDGAPNKILINENGTFQTLDLELGNNPSADGAVGDIDGDGDPDLVSANSGFNQGGFPNKIWINNSNYPNPTGELYQFKKNWNIYPNPVQETLFLANNVRAQSNIQYSVHDLTGKRLLNGKAENSSIDVSSIPKGVYILSLNIDNQAYNTKFLK